MIRSPDDLPDVPFVLIPKVWECNECGSQEYTTCVSEADVQELGCGNCGGCEWHLEDERP